MIDLLKEINLAIKSMLLQRNPARTDLIFDMVRIAGGLEKNRKSVEQVETALLENIDFRNMWEKQYLPTPPTKTSLAKMPSDSIGRAYLQHLETNGLDPNFYRAPKINRVIDYLSYRLYNVHDIWHTILTYDASIVGEIEVQAFTLGQIDSPISIFLITGGLYNILRATPEKSKESFDRVVRAYERGKKAKFFLGVPLEELLQEDVAAMRAQLNMDEIGDSYRIIGGGGVRLHPQ